MKVDEFKIITEDLKRRKIPAELKKAVSAMLDKKAEKVVVLKLKELNDITDFTCGGLRNMTVDDGADRRMTGQQDANTHQIIHQGHGIRDLPIDP